MEILPIAVIGGGPAGLRAAEVASASGTRVGLFDAKPSVGRKFLVAGKGGLNLTHGEDFEKFITRYSGSPLWEKLIADFTSADLRKWAADLGVETFQATSGRVYPKALKAAPLLRRWIERLKQQGVEFSMNHKLIGITPGPFFQIHFANGKTLSAQKVILALGGGSWPQTGSDGAWTEIFDGAPISTSAQNPNLPRLKIHPLVPANCGWEHAWPEQVLAAEGQPMKNLHVRAGDQLAIGELMLTRYGLEGGTLYALGAALRAMENPAISIDFKPTFTEEALIRKMESVRKNFLDEARIRWKLSNPTLAILSRKPWTDAASLAAEVKNCVIPFTQPRPISEAISSAGGVCWSELDDSLMIRKLPGLYLAGEMIDWEAPTGGYLMQGCFATGTHVGNAVLGS